MDKIDVSSYAVTDNFFGEPYIDADTWNEKPTPHRYLHGGFKGTDTRFAFCFPPPERYQGRLYQPLEGANAGHENVNTGPLGLVTGGLEMAFRLGGYTVESNMGHIGDVMDAKAGPDPTIYGFRAAAECARFSKHVAKQIYGKPTRYAYVFGGSGGARRSPLCLAYAPGVWDAALPYMGDAMDGDHGDMKRLRTGSPNFSSMFNVQRLLGPKIYDVVDAMWPGGSGDPFAGLNTLQREELVTLYRLGYPRGDEFMIAQPMGQTWLWASMAERLQREDAKYFEAFWTKPGYVGHDMPEAVKDDILNVHTTVARTYLAKEIAQGAEFQGAEYAALRGLAMIFAGMQGAAELPMAIELKDVPKGYRLGAGIKFLNGQAAGRQLYCISAAGKLFLCDGEGEASNLRFTGVRPGDEVHLDNRAFLAYCYYYRHHLLNHTEYDCMRLNGKPIFEQHPLPEMSPFMGVLHSGQFEGKLMWVHHTHDASLWPPQGLGMKNNVERVNGPEKAKKMFSLRWTENAEHVPPTMAASPPNRNNNTWLINYQPVIEQCLVDLAAWVEQGIEPPDTKFEYRDGAVILPTKAAERGGIQPVVAVTANGSTRAEIAAGESVKLQVHAEVPPGAGAIISVKWDFDGSGTYPETAKVDGKSTAVTLSTTHRYDKAGTYFVTALVESHREGDLKAIARRIPNVASARVVVK
jgi:hypothetical protein